LSFRTEAELAAMAPEVNYGAFDIGAADTTPGAACWCAPPAPIHADNYRAWLRTHYRLNRGVAQRMAATATYFRRGGALDVAGPYASELLAALADMATAAAAPRTTDTPGRARQR
jgi:hypothetical protein